jgi:hypothetical protein
LVLIQVSYNEWIKYLISKGDGTKMPRTQKKDGSWEAMRLRR